MRSALDALVASLRPRLDTEGLLREITEASAVLASASAEARGGAADRFRRSVDEGRLHSAGPAIEPEESSQAWYPEFARVVWRAIGPLRHALHHVEGVSRGCPTALAPYSPEDPAGSAAAAACSDCVSEHGEILCLTCRRFTEHRSEIVVPAGWAYRVAENLMLDRFRAMRVSLGALARADSRGVAKRVYDACATDWERHLAKLVLTYVGHHGPVPVEVWPYRLWLSEKARFTGEPEEGHARWAALHDDIALVLAIMRSRGGHTHVDGRRMTWYEAYVERPLGRRRRIDTVSLEQGPAVEEGRIVIDPPDPSLVRGYADRLISECARLVAEGGTLTSALRRVIPELLGTRGAGVIADRALMDRLARYVRAQVPEDLRDRG